MKIKCVASAVLVIAALAPAAIGQNVIGVGEPTGTVRNDTYTFGAGFEFYAPAGTGTTINSLGYWDQGGNGLATSHTVSLYSYAGSGSSYTLLATVTIDAGTMDPLVAGYRWANIGNLNLPDNGQGGGYYAILATHDGSDPWTDGIGGSPILNPLIGTISGNGVIDQTSGQTITQTPVNLAGNSNPGSVYGGANLGFTQPVPEPEVFALVGAGMAMFVTWRRKS